MIYLIIFDYYYVVLNQISLIHKVTDKHRKQTLPQRCLDHHGCLDRRHDFTQDPTGSKKHCITIIINNNNIITIQER